MFSIGGFLLGTPIGWAILTVLVVRHFYKRYLRRKNYEAYTNSYEQGNGYGQSDSYYSSTTDSNSEFASAYRQEENDEKVFSREDKNSAVDVEFTEVQ